MTARSPQVHVLAKDPHWMFSWWDLESQTPVLLRVHDVTDVIFDGTNSHFSFDIDVGASARGSWYIRVPHAGRVYLIEAGASDHGTFRPLARSNPAFFPSEGPSEDQTLRWTTLAW